MTELLKKDVQKFLTEHLRPLVTKEIKTKYAKAIRKRYSEKHVKKNFSSVLSETIRDESKIFNNINKKIKNYWLIEFIKLNDEFKKAYPVLKEKYNNYKSKHEILLKDKKINLPHENLRLMFDYFGDAISYAQMSQIQSGKSLAGKSLEHCISICLQSCNIQFEDQISKKSVDKSSSDIKKTDLILPSMTFALKNPRASFQAECQSTLADRFRLTLGKVTNIPMFCLTADGTDFFGQKDTIKKNMNEEAKDAGVTIVAFRNVAIKKRKLGYKNVISYEDFIKEIEINSKLWNEK